MHFLLEKFLGTVSYLQRPTKKKLNDISNERTMVEGLERRKASEDALRWRPSFHLTAPHGWLNDPCGLGYDPLTGKYHLSFQWNPKGNDWGNVSWGHSTSYDLVSWKTSADPSLTPSASYDHCGVFTGCMLPTDVDGKQDGTLIYIYTSVSRLPIHYTLPYVPGCESLSIAVSRDGGSSWKRFPGNPVLPGPPPGLKVTSWRDPFVSTSGPSGLDNINQGVSSSNKTLYGFVSGGVAEHTPTVFVYTINSNDLTQWKYAGNLLDVGLNFRPSRWSGDAGVNWEVASFMTLGDDRGTSRDFIIMGTEGCIPRNEACLKDKNVQTIAGDHRIQRSQLWMCIERASSSSRSSQRPSTHLPLTERLFGGILDHGCFYAANYFWDPVTSQHIIFGWITEEDLPDDLRRRQNWSGAISVPRVVKLTTIAGVKRARSSPDLENITSIEATPDDDGQGTYTVRTLGLFPDPRLERLRMKAHRTQVPSMTKLCPFQTRTPNQSLDTTFGFLPLKTSRWELDAEIEVGKHCSRVGVVIGYDNGRLTRAYRIRLRLLSLG